MQPHEANSSDNVGPTTYEKAVRLHQAGKTDEAIKSYRAVLKTHPDDGNLHNNLAVALHSQNRFDEAIQHYHAALTIDRDRPETLNNLAAAYKRKGDLDLAIHHYNLCLTLCPDYPEAHNNLGLALQKQGNIYDAIDHYQKAVTLDPDYVDARFHLSMALLLNGELKDGFALYDWRWRRRDWPPLPSQSLHWDGSPLMGKTLLITAEQGFGDTIQFIRYIGLIPKDGGHILVECQKPLLELFKCLQGIDGLFPQGKTLPAHDIYAPMMSLPRICGTTLETIPADIPYILSPQNHALNLENFPGTRLKIGIAWAGNPQHVNDAERSCRPDHFIPLFNMAEIRFYSLQKDCPVPAEMIKKYDQLVDLADRLEDFTDTAAFIDQLDLVIAVDTAVIHLAGAMGKPVWALLPYVPDWRWLMDRMDTPWYPTMRLFRQTQPSDWGSVFQKVRQTLCEFIA
jgi:tetratricopeptide (TPR) repeat protein